MVKLTSTLNRLNRCRILVAGDLMLDTYTMGKARRISPEAPVPIVQVLREENRAGGAGNVALNLSSLGAQAVIFSRIGDDMSGEILKKALAAEEIDLAGLFTEKGYATTLKNRVISDNQQLVRIDYEQLTPLSKTFEEQMLHAVPLLLKNVNALAISDYGKGFLTNALLKELIKVASSLNIPIITDPKGNDFLKYKGTTYIKPNLSEAYAAAQQEAGSSLEEAAAKLLETTQAETVIITRSEEGISLFSRNNERRDFPVRVHEIKDVTGAGDTVLAMFAYALANRVEIETAAELSNIAAGLAIEHVGCAQVTLSEMVHRLVEVDPVNKIFFESDYFVLKASLKGSPPPILLSISGLQGMTASIFSAIHQLSRRSETNLILCVQENHSDPEFLTLLASLRDVKFIVMQKDQDIELHDLVFPKEMYAILDNKLTLVTR